MAASVCSESKLPYVITTKTLMVATESKIVNLSFFNIQSPVKVFGGMPLLKLCPLYADTYDGEGE